VITACFNAFSAFLLAATVEVDGHAGRYEVRFNAFSAFLLAATLTTSAPRSMIGRFQCLLGFSPRRDLTLIWEAAEYRTGFQCLLGFSPRRDSFAVQSLKNGMEFQCLLGFSPRRDGKFRLPSLL